MGKIWYLLFQEELKQWYGLMPFNCGNTDIVDQGLNIVPMGKMWYLLFQGGIKAVVWTDAFQVVIITVGMLTLLIKGVIEVGSVDTVMQRVREGGRMPYFE